ncbi:hypothetical protein OPQ81_004351 [Rhizoctonia solani]|nr:hypothetical protein OPQ81_004351 [Rhizoctonia solani]
MAYCDLCDRYFNSDYAYDNHRRGSSRHHFCVPCGRDFQTSGQLNQHLRQSSRHYYCFFCQEDFDDDYDLSEHYQERHEYCDSCELWLDTTEDLVEHKRDEHYYCVECDRLFISLNNLQNHLNSSRHCPRNLSCPGAGCNEKFITKSALLQHCEADLISLPTRTGSLLVRLLRPGQPTEPGMGMPMNATFATRSSRLSPD